MRLSAVLGLMCVSAALAFAKPAAAALAFCNRTAGAIDAAVGYHDADENGAPQWVSEGWWRIEPGQCARVYGKPLTQRFYFYYATALTASAGKDVFVWGGKYLFCTDNKAFRAAGDSDCLSRGFAAKGFQQIDLGANTKDYTLDFRDGN
jgi:uncharacterized membrane protein